MINYLAEQNFKLDKFSLTCHPCISIPENVYDEYYAIEYGADFTMSFHRSASRKNRIGLLQLICPQKRVRDTARIGDWNVDKAEPGEGYNLARCLYGDDTETIGPHSHYYEGQHKRGLSSTDCWLLDTPREFSKKLEDGRLTSPPDTRFANYVVDLETGKAFDQGITWGYSVVQDPTNLKSFDMRIQQPKITALSKEDIHRQVIGDFLKLARDKVKDLIAR